MANAPNPATTRGMHRKGDNFSPGQSATHLPPIPEDPWPSYYTSRETDQAPAQVYTVVTIGGQTLYEDHSKCNDNVLASTPIRIDSGASFSVDGRSWMHACIGDLLHQLHPSSRFRKCGDGPAQPGLGISMISREIPQLRDVKNPLHRQIGIDIGDSAATCLISRQSLCKLDVQIDFATNVSTVCQ